MIKKLILFCFSPFAAVCIMVVPDAFTLVQRNFDLPEALESVTFGQDRTDLESRAWHGDWSAVEALGAEYAQVPVESEWNRSVSNWNKMLVTFMAPLLAVSLLSVPLSLVLFGLDRFRMSRDRPPKYYPAFMARYRAFKSHSHLVLTLWMSASYYLYRYWVLNG